MLSIKDIYELFEKVGACSFATYDGAGEIESRIAQFVAYSDEGLYFRTATVKRFYRHLMATGQVSVVGQYSPARVTRDEARMFVHEPGYMVRLSGKVRPLELEEVGALAAVDSNFDQVIMDMRRSRETTAFVLYEAHGDLFDYDFARATRDYPLHREAFAFGGDEPRELGLRVAPNCIGCGNCFTVCEFDALVPGKPASIIAERCGECGACYKACPIGAIIDNGHERDAD